MHFSTSTFMTPSPNMHLSSALMQNMQFLGAIWDKCKLYMGKIYHHDFLKRFWNVVMNYHCKAYTYVHIVYIHFFMGVFVWNQIVSMSC